MYILTTAGENSNTNPGLISPLSFKVRVGVTTISGGDINCDAIISVCGSVAISRVLGL